MELLESVGLDYYDRLEWLIRTNLRAAIDNLIVERARDERKKRRFQKEVFKKGSGRSQYGDIIEVPDLRVVGRKFKGMYETAEPADALRCAFDLPKRICGSGSERLSGAASCFYRMYQMDEEKPEKRTKKGIERAKKRGFMQVASGRKWMRSC